MMAAMDTGGERHRLAPTYDGRACAGLDKAGDARRQR